MSFIKLLSDHIRPLSVYSKWHNSDFLDNDCDKIKECIMFPFDIIAKKDNSKESDEIKVEDDAKVVEDIEMCMLDEITKLTHTNLIQFAEIYNQNGKISMTRCFAVMDRLLAEKGIETNGWGHFHDKKRNVHWFCSDDSLTMYIEPNNLEIHKHKPTLLATIISLFQSSKGMIGCIEGDIVNDCIVQNSSD